jgi:hypothetical protein
MGGTLATGAVAAGQRLPPDRAGLADQARQLVAAARGLGLSDLEIHDLLRSQP